MIEREVSREVKGKEFEVESQSIGVALVVVGIDPSRNGENASDPKIWTILEKKTKPETEKVAGQLSFPGETKKIEEELASNIVGALCEFTDSDFVVRNNLFMLPSSHVKGKVLIKNNPVDLAIVMYTGPLDHTFKPVDQNDVAPHGWMTMRDMGRIASQNQEKVRKFARTIIDMETSEQLVGKVVAEFSHSPVRRIPVSTILPPEFSSMAQFHDDRERRMPDVRIFDRSFVKK